MQKNIFSSSNHHLYSNRSRKMEPFWEPNGCPPHAVKYENDAPISGYSYCNENGLNFSASGAAYSEDDADFTPGRRGKVSRQDPLSHRIIEKRRRDRMNSCLADLSRLIPPQYQRKGRGRIEKTEIIEMSIRYMKQLQNQEYLQKDSAYKLGYEECMQQAASFLYQGHREVCYQLVNHLKEHSADLSKNEYIKHRQNMTSRKQASGDSPLMHQYHPAPLSQLRDLLSASDLEHSNSPDHTTDVKDLSFRNQPQQAAVITSTAPGTHMDGGGVNNHDHIDSNRPSPNHSENGHPNGGVLRNVRKMSDGFHDSDHSHYSYKIKNYFKERFSQDTHMDEATNESGNNSPSDELNGIGRVDISTGGSVGHNGSGIGAGGGGSLNTKVKNCIDYIDANSCDEKPSTNGITEFKPDVTVAGGAFGLFPNSPTLCNGGGGGGGGGIGGSGNGAAVTMGTTLAANKTVPIFALHSQGKFYIPLNVEYDCLFPYLADPGALLDKTSNLMPPALHNVNISVNFSAPRKLLVNQSKMKADSLSSNGW